MSDPPDSTATPSDSDLNTASPDISNPEENGMEPTETPTTDGLDNRVIQRYPPETLLSIRSSSLCVKPDELPGIEIFVIRDPNAEAKRDRKISNRGGRPPPADGKEYKEAGKEKELKKPQIVLGPPKTAFASSQQQTTAERRGPRRDMRDGEKASPLADRRKEREIGHLGEKDRDNGKEEYRERVGGYRNREPGFGRTDKQDAKANAGRDYGRNFNEWRRDGEKGSARDYSGAADRRRNPPRDRDSYQFSQPNESTPEWMNYDPNDSSTYQSDKGLDPMQKFKLEMQQREKAAQVQSENSEDSGLDAIQQFKLQMQKSEKKDGTRMADNALDEMALEEEHALEAGGLEDQSDYERERNPKDRMGQDEAMQETHDSKVAFSKLDAFFNTKPATPAAYAAIKSKFAGRLFQLEDEDDDDEALEPSPPRHQYPNPHDQRRIQLQQLAEQQQRQAPRPMPTDVDRQTVEADLRNFLLGGQRNSPPNHPQIQTIPMSQDSYRPYPQQQRQPSPRSAEDAQGFSKILAALAKANINGPGDSSPSDDGRSSQYRGQGYGDNRMHGNYEHPPIPHDPAIQSMSRQQQDQNLTPESARRQALLMGANVPTAVLRQLGGKVAVKSVPERKPSPPSNMRDHYQTPQNQSPPNLPHMQQPQQFKMHPPHQFPPPHLLPGHPGHHLPPQFFPPPHHAHLPPHLQPQPPQNLQNMPQFPPPPHSHTPSAIPTIPITGEHILSMLHNRPAPPPSHSPQLQHRFHQQHMLGPNGMPVQMPVQLPVQMSNLQGLPQNQGQRSPYVGSGAGQGPQGQFIRPGLSGQGGSR